MKQLQNNVVRKIKNSIGIFFITSTLHAQSNVDIDALIAKMTIEEKVGQMTQLNLDVVCEGGIYNLVEPHHIEPAKLHKALVEYHVGSILNCGGHAYGLDQWHTIINTIQQVATTETRLKIPVIYGIDAIHGANYTLGSTLFPQPLAQAASWNTDMVKRGGEITAYEVRATGIPWNFSPVLDLGRDPRWSRLFETYGEDVLLATEMGLATIEGYQGNNLADAYHVAACMKHFLGYSMPRTGKDRTPVYIDEIQLREYFLPTFQAAINAGAATVMINSGELNGIPVHADKKILTDLLRSELGFKGVAVTDWEDIMKLNNIHMVAPTLKDAVYMAIDAGIDMCMVPNDYDFTILLTELVKEGKISEARLDVSVKRILELKKQLGLFEQPFTPANTDYKKFGSAEFARAAQNMVEESITLLKNNNQTLPIKTETKIFVTGPAANSMTYLNGAWTRTWQGTDTIWNDQSKYTIREAFNAATTTFIASDNMSDASVREKMLAAAKASDVIIICLGEKPSTEKVGDIDALTMPDNQQQLVGLLKSVGKPIVLVLVENRPLIVNDIEPLCDAIVLAYEPGDYGGLALANIIYGKVNPSGKLPFTYPRHEASLLWYDHKHTETLDQTFGRKAFNPQWEFGYGLSYTTFQYSNLKISNDTLSTGNLQISVEVTNTGTSAGKEVVQLYIADRYASITPSVKRLRGFEKVEIKPGATHIVTFTISAKDLAFVGRDEQWMSEAGWFDIMLGSEKSSFYLSK
ncbi:MAG TPA: glycoside hydrolase family 3 N-terminal domain-containing protein [Chitinophagales bacterium]|nr:glycoside hydrolase family 3 N-terminal domain-containing protein [Chitinophagales bacterium]